MRSHRHGPWFTTSRETPSRRALLSAAAVACVCPLALGFQTSPSPEYTTLDNVEGAFVNLATFPVRPMVWDASGNLWAINHHDSTLVKFTNGTGTGTQAWMPWNPVAIAYWDGGTPGSSATSDDELLVSCRGSWCVAVYSLATSSIKYVIQERPDSSDPSRMGKMAEPGDILVIGSRAFVACTGSDAVVQIDLTTHKIERRYHETAGGYDSGGTWTSQSFAAMRMKSPLFLSPDGTGGLYVAPLISGNNTIGDGTQNQPFADSAVNPAGTTALPDEDLVHITSPTTTPSVSVAASGMGTILFAHGTNPSTGDIWQLNTEAHNTLAQSEPELNGIFASNRISVLSGTTVTPWNLRVGGTSVPHGLSHSIGEPYGLTFVEDSGSGHYGEALVCGVLTNNVVVLDASVSEIGYWSLPTGAIPRQVLLNEALDTAYVYCWGTNEILRYDWQSSTPTQQGSALSLGHDPRPTAIQDGERVFFDGSHSRHGDLSCASCHVEGGADFVGWNLSNKPLDDKGVMVTQTLVGIGRVAPFHWRGERQLAHFNAAFKGLLGNEVSSVPSELDATSFAQLSDYMRSLVNPANPHQDRERVLNAALHQPGTAEVGDALNGQDLFLHHSVFRGEHACASCHDQPTGSSSDFNTEQESLQQPRRAQMKPAAFQEVWRKEQTLVTGIKFPTGTTTVTDSAPFLGTGATHAGKFKNIAQFIGGITTTDQYDASDMADFVGQWDAGLGQATHYACLLDANTSTADVSELGSFLYVQARGRLNETTSSTVRRNCDVVVFGSTPTYGRHRWYLDRYVLDATTSDPLFVMDDGVTTRTLSDFTTNRSTEKNVFLGLPVGMGERFGVDYDLDGIYNTADSSRYVAASTGNPSAPAVAFQHHTGTSEIAIPWSSTRNARVTFEANVPVRWQVKYTPDGQAGSAKTITSGDYARTNSLILIDLEPPTGTSLTLSGHSGYSSAPRTYDVEVTIWDRTGAFVTANRSFSPDKFIENIAGFDQTNIRQYRKLANHFISGGTMTSQTASNSSRTARKVDCVVELRRGGTFTSSGFVRPAAERRVLIGRAMLRNTTTLEVVPVDPAKCWALGGAREADEVRLDTEGGPSLPANTTGDYTGHLLVASEAVTGLPYEFLASPLVTDSSGAVSIAFEVETPTYPFEVLFNVEAVLEVTNKIEWETPVLSTYPIEHTTSTGVRQLRVPAAKTSTEKDAYTQWSFPATGELYSTFVN